LIEDGGFVGQVANLLRKGTRFQGYHHVGFQDTEKFDGLFGFSLAPIKIRQMERVMALVLELGLKR